MKSPKVVYCEELKPESLQAFVQDDFAVDALICRITPASGTA